jgi:hypothetical protein
MEREGGWRLRWGRDQQCLKWNGSLKRSGELPMGELKDDSGS